MLSSRPVGTYFARQGGIRYDIDSLPGRGWAALGVQGLAPYFFEVSATAYASDSGHYAARLEGSYDLLFTQRLILRPQAELNFYSKDDPSRGIGSGFSDLDAGLRLRYEFSRKFAPYIGVSWERKAGGTADFARQAGGDPAKDAFVTGIPPWF